MNYPRHSDTPRDLEYFQNKFDCRIEDSTRFNQYVRPQPYHLDFADSSQFDCQMHTRVLPMKAIHLTSDNLARLVAEQEHLDRLQQDAEYGKQAWVSQRQDQSVREANPAVDQAYRRYQLLLELARK